ncbi:urease accessory protein UreE (plasmid) [Deinococcus aetherius]|uniref:Urease accessory protein UreE n=1 Tax=Deinococcus aetherius TaxID=200252 RepID=A0ABM8AKD3_9DEIO|nr:urease accessory protein UreE [Deinococcus aetherius]BDP44272.1 urease accessory protein UreE [Deinococcus aetherius]
MTRLSGLRRAVLPAPAAPAGAQGRVIHVPMTAADRRRVRRRLTAPDGAELRLAFPTGTVLLPGSVLERRGGVSYVVEAAPEDVAAVRPRGMAEAARVAHAVGNLHRDLVEDGDAFLVLWDAPVELLLTRLGVPFTREDRPFHGRPSWEHEP